MFRKQIGLSHSTERLQTRVFVETDAGADVRSAIGVPWAEWPAASEAELWLLLEVDSNTGVSASSGRPAEAEDADWLFIEDDPDTRVVLWSDWLLGAGTEYWLLSGIDERVWDEIVLLMLHLLPTLRPLSSLQLDVSPPTLWKVTVLSSLRVTQAIWCPFFVPHMSSLIISSSGLALIKPSNLVNEKLPSSERGTYWSNLDPWVQRKVPNSLYSHNSFQTITYIDFHG